MGFPEPAAMTDAEYLKREVTRLNDKLEAQQDRLDAQTTAINLLGKNIQWMVDNVQGIFQMFSDPNVINQTMNGVMSMMSGGGNDDGE